MGLAPTTSTTMSLALGDALAVALLERKGFSAQDFRVLHPGGKLGSSLLRVSDLMHEDDAVPLVEADIAMQDVIPVMSEKRFGCVGVIDHTGDLLGIITDGDLRRTLVESSFAFGRRRDDAVAAVDQAASSCGGGRRLDE